MREHLALESPRETRDATPAPATPPQNASTISRDTTSASFADLRQLIAKRGAPFTGRVRVDTSASASKPLEPSGAGVAYEARRVDAVAPGAGFHARAGVWGMRDMFFVEQDNINFNASYGTPVREVRFSHPPKTPNARALFSKPKIARRRIERLRTRTSACIRFHSPPPPLTREPSRAISHQVLEKQWAYHVECETSPHEWMLGVAAMKLRAARADLACYVNAEARDVVLVENCTAAATATIRSARLRARRRGDPPQHRVRDGQERAQACRGRGGRGPC